MADQPEGNLAVWWEQFEDPLLTSLIERALTSNYDLRIAREKICEARALYQLDFSTLLPKVDALVVFDRMRNSETLFQSDFTGGDFVNFYQTGFDAFWEIDLFGKNRARTRAACYEVAAATAEVRDVHVSIASEVALNYFIIRTLQERVDITNRHIEAERELLKLVSNRYDAGLISELDVYTARGLLESRRATLPEFEQRLYQTVYVLAVLIGELPENLLNSFCDTQKPPCGEQKFPLGLPSELLCRRGDVRAAEFEMHAAGTRVMAARREFFPTISLDSLYTYATGFFTSWIKPESREWTMMPSLLLPVFHGGEILSHVNIETSRQRQAVLSYEKSVLVALQEVEGALTGYFQEGARLQALENEVEAYSQASDLSRTLYFGGIVDFLYVIETEREYFIAEILRSGAHEDLMTQLVAVYKALGGGWECCD